MSPCPIFLIIKLQLTLLVKGIIEKEKPILKEAVESEGKIMGYKEKIKEKLVDPALERGELDRLEKASAVWKTAAEAEKLELDTAQSKSKARSESVRFWIPIIAPLIGAVALIATLVFQMRQFQENTRLAREAAEDKAWMEVVKGLGEGRGLQGVHAISQLKPFLDSERYKKLAREISINSLGRIIDPDVFKIIFPDISERTDWNNFNDLTRIAAQLNRGYKNTSEEPLPTKVGWWQRLWGGGQKKPAYAIPGVPPDSSIISAGYDEEMTIVGNAIAKFLKDHRADRPANNRLDFTNVFFCANDLSNIDFSGSILRETIFFNCTVVDSNFINVSDCENSEWKQTAWWHARKMDKGLLDYLEKKYPYEKGISYYNDSTKDDTEYLKAVERLKNQTN